ncbi:MAG: hypothetical protein A4E30_00253 [Methanomassiliicoccales archaeon PtaB.Bin215]|nr:MAG: hypothetical protein A4E30_00253 [Methanomassiliicoccales archaeon PtaB.Bin215]
MQNICAANSMAETSDQPSKPKISRRRAGIIILGIAVLIVTAILLTYWASPALSLFPEEKDTDGDGVPDGTDAFPAIASQWSDLDGDGFGDNLNGITPDRFPNEPTQWFDHDRDGYGDNPDGLNPDDFPADPTQWRDTDRDGYGDDPNGTDPDAFPLNSLEWRDSDGDMCGDNSDAYPNNPKYWWTGHATIFVQVVSTHDHLIAYGVYVNGHGSADGYMMPFASNITMIEFTYPCGVTNDIFMEITGESMGLEWDTTSFTVQLSVEPDMTYHVRLML